MTFYNSHGKPIAYLADEQHIFLFNGRPVAYLYDNKVYGFNGHHFGWFEDGWIRDKRCRGVVFTEDASGSGPAKPAKYARPAKCAKYAKPAKCAKYAACARPAKSSSWSELSGEQFFEQ